MLKLENLLFDLDGTLYPYSSGTQNLFDERIVFFFKKNLEFQKKMPLLNVMNS